MVKDRMKHISPVWESVALMDENHEGPSLLEEALLFSIRCGYTHRNEDFFQALARYIADRLKVDFVCIDKLEEDGLIARMVVNYFDGQFKENVAYALNDTPCGTVVSKGICSFSRNVRSMFPKDADLQDMAAESYVGTLLYGYNGEPIGLIAIISREPMENTKRAELLLEIVGVRAAGELERREAEKRHIQYLTDTIQQEQLAKRHAELTLLRDRINAHFLCNTLDNVNWMLSKYQAQDVADVIDNMTSLFRSGYSGGQNFITLEEEFGHVEAYLNIQKIRFEDLVEYNLNLPEALRRYKVQKSVLQPLVENSIAHGFNKMETGGEINISAKIHRNHVVLEVADNGSGISKKTLVSVYKQMNNEDLQIDSNSGHGYGLYNVHQRIGLMHGEDYGITFDTREDSGCCVRITYPIIEE